MLNAMLTLCTFLEITVLKNLYEHDYEIQSWSLKVFLQNCEGEGSQT